MTIPLNMRTVNVILIGMIMLFTVVSVVRVFLTNPDAKRCRAMNIPFGQNKNKEEKKKNGEGKRRNEFAEWHVAWLAEWHNYAEFNIRRSFSKK